MSSTPVTVTVDDLRKTLSVSSPLILRTRQAISVSPAELAAGSCVLALTHLGQPVADTILTDGTGVLDLSTPQALALFASLPPDYRLRVYAELETADGDRQLAASYVTLRNNCASSLASVRVAGAGELQLTLSENMEPGTPVMLADGEAAPCLAADAHRYLGILRDGGLTGETATCVTAGLVCVPGWALAPGSAYYLSRTSAMLTATPPTGYNVRIAGIALDASTLALCDAPVIQTLADGTPHTLVWDQASRRFMAAAAAAASTGSADAGRIPCLGADGRLDASLYATPANFAAAILPPLFASVAALDPNLADGEAITNKLNEIISILKG